MPSIRPPSIVGPCSTYISCQETRVWLLGIPEDELFRGIPFMT